MKEVFRKAGCNLKRGRSRVRCGRGGRKSLESSQRCPYDMDTI